MIRDFLQKANVWDNEVKGEGMWLSEKLDGLRMFWDGGITVGMKGSEVPWCHKNDSEVKSTGCWSNGCKIIYVPENWTKCLLDEYGGQPIEGELYLGRNRFQETTSIARKTINANEQEWQGIGFYVFNDVDWNNFLSVGDIKVRNEVVSRITYSDYVKWKDKISIKREYYFIDWYNNFKQCGVVRWVEQIYVKTKADIEERVGACVRAGGEGGILRSVYNIWLPKRKRIVQKIKPFEDAECYVHGFVMGKGRLEGKVGALEVRDALTGVNFQIGTGLTDEERSLTYFNECLLGKVATYKYRELSVDNVPKEARFWRQNNG